MVDCMAFNHLANWRQWTWHFDFCTVRGKQQVTTIVKQVVGLLGWFNTKLIAWLQLLSMKNNLLDSLTSLWSHNPCRQTCYWQISLGFCKLEQIITTTLVHLGFQLDRTFMSWLWPSSMSHACKLCPKVDLAGIGLWHEPGIPRSCQFGRGEGHWGGWAYDQEVLFLDTLWSKLLSSSFGKAGRKVSDECPNFLSTELWLPINVNGIVYCDKLWLLRHQQVSLKTQQNVRNKVEPYMKMSFQLYIKQFLHKKKNINK